MNLLWLVAFSAMISGCHGLFSVSSNFTCEINAEKYIMTAYLEVTSTNTFIDETEGSVYFFDKANADAPLTATCSKGSGQITGAGTTLNPFTVNITVDPVTYVSTPDCGYERTGNVFNWTAFIQEKDPVSGLPVGGPSGDFTTADYTCDFDTVTNNPTIEVGVNTSGTNNSLINTTTLLQSVSVPVQMYLWTESFQPAGTNLVVDVNSAYRVILEIEGDEGIYAYNMKACDNPLCSNLHFQMLDDDGCPTSDFTELIKGTPTGQGTVMFPFTGFDKRAISELYRAFRFVKTNEIYFFTNVGFCTNFAELFCSEHCLFISGRKKRETPRNEREADHLTIFVVIEDANTPYLIGYPDGESPFLNKTSGTIFREPEVESCMDKPGFIAVLALLGTSVLASVIVALVFGLKLSNESGKICGYW